MVMTALLAQRVDSLENILAHFIMSTESALNTLTRNVNQLHEEMLAFKDEMRAYRDASEKNMLAFKDEMEADRLAFKDRMEQEQKKANKQWAELAKKMGTIDEDLIAPAARPAVRKYFHCEPVSRAIRLERDKNGETFEVDVIVECKDMVFMIEVKSTPRSDDIPDILAKAERFKYFFPEYEGKTLAPIFGSIIFPDNILKYATRKGLYVMAYREWDYIDILNFDEVNQAKDSG
jgi:hypothetical protein